MIVSRKNFRIPACAEACPAGLDVPRYIRYVKKGKFAEALAVIHERIPLPTVCADACFAPCENACSYRQLGEPIAIRALKRAAADSKSDAWKKNKKAAVKTGKKIAIIGAGPTGLTAAYYLAGLGHSVTLYDSFPKPGGVMRYGIPRYRLPEDRLDEDIREILNLGVEFRPSTTIGKQNELKALKKENDAILLATGTTSSTKIDIEGLADAGALWAWDFLRDVSLGKKFVFNGEVIVIGGGNVAIDASLTARRLGANKVSLVCLEKAEEMPAHEWEIARAFEEGVTIYNGWGPQKLTREGDIITLHLKKCVSVFDKAGKFNPVYDEKTRKILKARHIILAIGQTADLSYLKGENRIEIAKGTVNVDRETLATGEPGVFAGGDVVSGPSSVIEAIAQGRKAAVSIDKYLGGKGDISEQLIAPEKDVTLTELTCIAEPRVEMPLLSMKERDGNFRQIEQSYSAQKARKEAKRCLMCDVREFEVTVYPENCKECGYCIEICKPGVFELANGFNEKGYRPVKSKAPEKCVGCLQCFFVCPDFAIEIKKANQKERAFTK